MRVNLLYFGLLKELLKTSGGPFDLPDGATVGDLLRIVRGQTSNQSNQERGASSIPELVPDPAPESALAGGLAVAVNREYVAADSVLSFILNDGDEVALLPPVSGGVWRTLRDHER